MKLRLKNKGEALSNSKRKEFTYSYYRSLTEKPKQLQVHCLTHKILVYDKKIFTYQLRAIKSLVKNMKECIIYQEGQKMQTIAESEFAMDVEVTH